MRVATAILGALATIVFADDIRLNIHKRVEPTKIIQVIEARGTPECTSAVFAFAEAVTGSDPLPTPPLELESWAATAALANSTVDPCATVSVTGSIGAVYTSWSNSVESWQTAHMSEMRDMWHECTDIPLISAEVKSMLESGSFCTSKLAALTSEASGAEKTAVSQNLAPRETGMAVAAAAAAGFVFAAMQ
ncbi:hypothetical protein ColTof4_05354 [Colletotrichum tofieldiae]|uniref:Infection structure specific protein n=1 Tax=Colletotrichum tofieldiae TaxID=708197 RepID=A0A161YLB8_9PEZI|nr:hypothetical protein CT0861_11997 [Colletotrichum tofieldiae]GKT63054.1 hypothetical protein ColTof3_10393 [Colletotrichum tofieldiae]GKT72931.1 hypothetical protein ColTof4_05354 [Colletotrichum tofieldiae]